jgi:hypothetical protein
MAATGIAAIPIGTAFVFLLIGATIWLLFKARGFAVAKCE